MVNQLPGLAVVDVYSGGENASNNILFRFHRPVEQLICLTVIPELEILEEPEKIL